MPEIRREKKVRLGYLQSIKYLASELDVYSAIGTEEDSGTASRFDDLEDTLIPGAGGDVEGTSTISTSVADTGWVKGDEELEVHYDRGRTAIGISDIQIGSKEYLESSVFVSKPMKFKRQIAGVRLITDEIIPKSFDSDSRWIKYEIDFGEGTFVEISPENIGTINSIPIYVIPDNISTTIRLKITLVRPTSVDRETPILKGYQLKVEIVPV